MAILPNYNDDKKHIHVLSYGGGTQSTALLLMALKGEINGIKPDYIIFSDTGWEPDHIYKWVEKINQYIKEKFDQEIMIVQHRNIKNDLLVADTGKTKPFVPIPLFIKNDDGTTSFNKRQCTEDYKIAPIKKAIRNLLGYEPRKRVKEIVHIWKGISTDEIQRVKPSREIWQVAEHPLIEVVNMDRTSCINYVEKEGLGTPPKSSCVGCPFHDNRAWKEIKLNHPEEFNEVVQIEKAIQENNEKYKIFKGIPYLHRSCKPLDQVYLEENQLEMDWFINECEGMCGV